MLTFGPGRNQRSDHDENMSTQGSPSGHIPPGERLDRARTRRQDLRLAMEALEIAVSGPVQSESEWLANVRRAVADLGQALQAHVDEVESEAGLLAEVVDHEPRLSQMADELRAEHPELLMAWQRVSNALDEPQPDSRAVRRRSVALLGRLTMHRQAGADLVYEAYQVDIGGRG
jgi:hypothetical protein